jgi:hypothetical protein
MSGGSARRPREQTLDQLLNMAFHEIQNRLAALLIEAGCQDYTARRALSDAVECRREINRDNKAHGSAEEPFCNWIATEDVGIFTFYGSRIEFYIIHAEETELLKLLGTLAMSDVDAHRSLLRLKFDRVEPDLIIDPILSRAWLLSSGD